MMTHIQNLERTDLQFERLQGNRDVFCSVTPKGSDANYLENENQKSPERDGIIKLMLGNIAIKNVGAIVAVTKTIVSLENFLKIRKSIKKTRMQNLQTNKSVKVR